MLITSPLFAADPVRPSAAAVTLQPSAMQTGVRIGAQAGSKKRSDLAPVALGAVIAAAVAGGVGIAVAASNGGGSSSTSP
jgi:hypothetical protein